MDLERAYMLNLYWPVYENIENEVIDLTKTIHFCDDQLDTYSTRISDLFLRCSVEIESIAKELFNTQFCVGDSFKTGNKKSITCILDEDMNWKYRNKKGELVVRNLHFDYDCIEYLIKKWKLEERTVLINCSNMFFSQKENIVLMPLSETELTLSHSNKNRGGWLKSYHAIKHSRIRNLSLGSLYYMIHALSALYILNIYYKYNKSITVFSLSPYTNEDFNLNCGSKIFTTTKGMSVYDVFIEQYNGILELNIDQKVRYVSIDSEGFPVYAGVEEVAFEVGSIGEIDVPFEKEQERNIS